VRGLGPWLTRWHRRLAILGALPLALWFASGLAMPFARYPSLSSDDALRGLAPVGPAGTFEASPCAGPLVVTRLASGRRGARCGQEAAFGPEDGHVGDTPIAPEEAIARAYAYFRAGSPPGATPTSAETIDEADLWTLPQRFAPHFPLLRVRFDDDVATEIDVSLRTGDVVQATDRAARFRAWLGPVPHWLYVVALRRHRDPWRWVVMALALVATLPIVTGLWNGLRVTWRSRGGGRWSPYRDLALRRHHALGLVAGAAALFWTTSGLLSVNPGAWSTGLAPSDADRTAWRGGDRLAATAADVAACPHASTVQWEIDVVGATHLTNCRSPAGASLLVDGVPAARVPDDALRAATARLLLARGERAPPTAAVPRAEDDVYIDARAGTAVEIVWAGHTRIAYDASTGHLLEVSSTSGRLERWLYGALHRWDPPALMRRPLLRRAAQLTFLALGIALIASGGTAAVRRRAMALVRARASKSDRGAERSG
jgi:hypothetical protein